MERVVQMLCRASEGLVDSRVLAFNTGKETVEEVVEGVPVTRVGVTLTGGSVPVAPSFPDWMRRLDADLVILHEPNPWALLAYSLVPPKAPLAIWYHSDVVRPRLQYALFYAPIARRPYSRARWFLVSSPPLAEHARALQTYQSRVRVIPFGIDPAAWPAAAPAEECDPPFVLFAGRHVAYKGVDVLLRAVQGTRVHVVIAGDGPKRAEWEALSRSLGIERQVRFSGDVSDAELRGLLRQCAVLALPSVTRAEAFGYVQLEAMATARPVVSTDVPSGVSWVNRHEATGLVVPAGDPAALRTALERLIGDPALRRSFGAAGRLRVEQEFSMIKLRERLVAFYAEAIL
jgi:rhamnosyl/mannosyltransferase